MVSGVLTSLARPFICTCTRRATGGMCQFNQTSCTAHSCNTTTELCVAVHDPGSGIAHTCRPRHMIINVTTHYHDPICGESTKAGSMACKEEDAGVLVALEFCGEILAGKSVFAHDLKRGQVKYPSGPQFAGTRNASATLVGERTQTRAVLLMQGPDLTPWGRDDIAAAVETTCNAPLLLVGRSRVLPNETAHCCRFFQAALGNLVGVPPFLRSTAAPAPALAPGTDTGTGVGYTDDNKTGGASDFEDSLEPKRASLSLAAGISAAAFLVLVASFLLLVWIKRREKHMINSPRNSLAILHNNAKLPQRKAMSFVNPAFQKEMDGRDDVALAQLHGIVQAWSDTEDDGGGGMNKYVKTKRLHRQNLNGSSIASGGSGTGRIQGPSRRGSVANPASLPMGIGFEPRDIYSVGAYDSGEDDDVDSDSSSDGEQVAGFNEDDFSDNEFEDETSYIQIGNRNQPGRINTTPANVLDDSISQNVDRASPQVRPRTLDDSDESDSATDPYLQIGTFGDGADPAGYVKVNGGVEFDQVVGNHAFDSDESEDSDVADPYIQVGNAGSDGGDGIEGADIVQDHGLDDSDDDPYIQVGNAAATDRLFQAFNYDSDELDPYMQAGGGGDGAAKYNVTEDHGLDDDSDDDPYLRIGTPLPRDEAHSTPVDTRISTSTPVPRFSGAKDWKSTLRARELEHRGDAASLNYTRPHTAWGTGPTVRPETAWGTGPMLGNDSDRPVTAWGEGPDDSHSGSGGSVDTANIQPLARPKMSPTDTRRRRVGLYLKPSPLASSGSRPEGPVYVRTAGVVPVTRLGGKKGTQGNTVQKGNVKGDDGRTRGFIEI